MPGALVEKKSVTLVFGKILHKHAYDSATGDTVWCDRSTAASIHRDDVR